MGSGDPVATTTPTGLPGWGPRFASGSDLFGFADFLAMQVESGACMALLEAALHSSAGRSLDMEPVIPPRQGVELAAWLVPHSDVPALPREHEG